MLRKTSCAIIVSALVFSQVERKAHAIEPATITALGTAAAVLVKAVFDGITGSSLSDDQIKELKAAITSVKTDVINAIGTVARVEVRACARSSLDNLTTVQQNSVTLQVREKLATEANACKNEIEELLKEAEVLNFSQEVMANLGPAATAVTIATLTLYELAGLSHPDNTLTNMSNTNNLVIEALEPSCGWPTGQVEIPFPPYFVTFPLKNGSVSCTSYDGSSRATSPEMAYEKYQANEEFINYQVRKVVGEETAYGLAITVNEAIEAQN